MKLVFVIFLTVFGWKASVLAFMFSLQQRNILLSTQDVDQRSKDSVESNRATHEKKDNFLHINLLQPGNATYSINNDSIHKNTSFFAIIEILLSGPIIVKKDPSHEDKACDKIAAVTSDLSTTTENAFKIVKTAAVSKVDENSNVGTTDTPPVRGKEYFFIGDSDGFVVIIDANTHERNTSYTRSELAGTSVAVVGDTFYKIDSTKGLITSTPVENLITQNIMWAEAGSFPSEGYYITNSAVAKDKLIYFVTFFGKLYSYDTVTKTVRKLEEILTHDSYVSLVAVKNTIYIFKASYLYSFDGSTVEIISTPPNARAYSALFELEGNVCVVGGNNTNISPDPVQCYDPVRKTWAIHSYINSARKILGVAKSTSGVHIFGGFCWSKNKACDSAERLDVDENKWSYILNPYLNLDYNKDSNLHYPRSQAVTFYV